MVKTQCMSIILTLNLITCIQYTDIGIKKNAIWLLAFSSFFPQKRKKRI